MTGHSTPSGVDRLNVGLGALAALLGAAILVVLFVGTSDPSGSEAIPPADQAASSTIAESATTSVQDPVTSDVPPPSAAADFAMPTDLLGVWASPDSTTTAQFGPDTVEAFQTTAEIQGEPRLIELTEASPLGFVPSTTQPVQAILSLTTRTDTTLTRAQPVLVEFLATGLGLRLTFEIDGTMVEDHLLPTP